MKRDLNLDDSLVSVLDRYAEASAPTGTLLRNALRNLQNGEMIVPVLGMQGMGKSTVINAILKENILPNDTDETTCVPVEVKYGEQEFAEAFFINSQNKEILHTREELNVFVDNNYNPANKKGVSRIVLYRKNELLKSGLVIVDLPGVGSLTKENENTTKRYVENLCTAIFVIPTVPTIRKMEALFIKAVWSQFTDAIFVQNNWSHPDREIEESVDWNTKKLKEIAREINNSFDESILVVNAYDGIKGALTHNQAMVDSSGINALLSKIVQLSENWQDDKQNAFENRIKLALLSTKQEICKRIENLDKTEEEIQNQKAAEYKKYCDETNRIKSLISEIKRYLEDKQDEIFVFSSKESEACAGRIRAQIFHLIDKGNVDGQRLSKAFEDIQNDEFEKTFEVLSSKLAEIKVDLEARLENLKDALSVDSNNMESACFSKPKSFKFEKGIAFAFDLAGGIGGVVYAGPVAAALLGSNPAGWAIAAIGLGIAAIASLTGHGIKKIVANNRASETKKEISPVIDKLECSLKNKIRDSYNDMKNNVEKSLGDILRQRSQEENSLCSAMKSKTDSVDKKQLVEDLNYIEREINAYKNV